MTELAARLRNVRDQLSRLEALTRDDPAAARQLVTELTRELNQALDAAEEQDGAGAARKPEEPRPPRDPIEKCPRCTLRGFTFQEGTIRESATRAGHYEALYHCMSCGYEAWRPL
ncbi:MULTISPECIES: hypothetical protein [unclassified Thioalkalivibrio]|uniref:hypothetical protein n=1 Tax=unclassified Thioalkalivibrio TaxID=2621013 RepID=UPI00036798B3|nr:MULTISPECIES: hypothetical protein [unclassified Thioalkalivibrio]